MIPGNRHAIAVVALLGALAPSEAIAAELLCTHPGSPEITIALNSRTAFGHTLSCIAGDFVQDMTPCAPAGGYGLSRGTGDAGLIGIVMDWHAYRNHIGGVAQFVSTPAKYYFSGGFMGFRGLEQKWRFEVSRLTGQGSLTAPGQSPVSYACRAARQMF